MRFQLGQDGKVEGLVVLGVHRTQFESLPVELHVKMGLPDQSQVFILGKTLFSGEVETEVSPKPTSPDRNPLPQWPVSLGYTILVFGDSDLPFFDRKVEDMVFHDQAVNYWYASPHDHRERFKKPLVAALRNQILEYGPTRDLCMAMARNASEKDDFSLAIAGLRIVEYPYWEDLLDALAKWGSRTSRRKDVEAAAFLLTPKSDRD